MTETNSERLNRRSVERLAQRFPDAGISPDRTLREQLARRIRADVHLSYGPNAQEILGRGGTLPLNSGEADEAAGAALAALKDAGLTVINRATLDQLTAIAQHVSRGRRMVDVEPYPDAVARQALGTFDRWDDSAFPGGYVCAICGVPVESEPCADHGPKGSE